MEASAARAPAMMPSSGPAPEPEPRGEGGAWRLPPLAALAALPPLTTLDAPDVVELVDWRRARDTLFTNSSTHAVL